MLHLIWELIHCWRERKDGLTFYSEEEEHVLDRCLCQSNPACRINRLIAACQPGTLQGKTVVTLLFRNERTQGARLCLGLSFQVRNRSRRAIGGKNLVDHFHVIRQCLAGAA